MKSAIVESLAVFRVELDRFIEIAHGAIAVAFGAIGLAAVSEGCRLLLLGMCLLDHRGAIGDAAVRRAVVLDAAQPDLFVRERESGGRDQHYADRRRRADDEAPRSPCHAASVTPGFEVAFTGLVY